MGGRRELGGDGRVHWGAHCLLGDSHSEAMANHEVCFAATEPISKGSKGQTSNMMEMSIALAVATVRKQKFWTRRIIPVTVGTVGDASLHACKAQFILY